jgi:hypothetical protein
MLIGHGFDRLEQRITNALCSGSLRLKEAEFLQNISRRIGLYRERTFLSDDQASWLFTILTSLERGATGRSSKTRTPAGSSWGTPPRSSPENASESLQLMRALAGLDNVSWAEEETPEAFDINRALEPAIEKNPGSSPSRLAPTES